ncbi:MAG: tRNA threonylcarbamoyladenosine dehydratase [Clostridia bacterium]|nr:tRNA threonylcarbamoyladenosine dehydratase [Clostridia bacterium]
MDQFSRSALLIGREGIEKLSRARVALFGVGGVGGYVAEALARSGIGSFDLFDPDSVSLTNLNRQIVALHSTLGQPKAETLARRLKDINPAIKVTAHPLFYLPENADQVDLSAFDYIADAIDTVTAKLDLIERAYHLGVPMISAMGAGNRLDPSQVRVGDIFETKDCPLARIMRKELRKRGIPSLRVAYSTEPALSPLPEEAAALQAETPASDAPRRDTPGSMLFVPAAMGLIMAAAIVRDLAQI